MEANRRNAEDGISLRLSQASNKDIASGGTGSMVQDDETWDYPFSDESEGPIPSNDHSDDDQSNAIQRLVEIAEQAHSDNDRSRRKELEDAVRDALDQYRASLSGFHDPPSSYASSGLEETLGEMLQGSESEGFTPWASALVLATKLRLDCITIRHPTFEHRYGEKRLKFATGLPWRSVFRTNADVIHILATNDSGPTRIEGLLEDLGKARQSLRPPMFEMVKMYNDSSPVKGIHAIIELEINGSPFSERFDREVKEGRNHSNLLKGLARCMLKETETRNNRLRSRLKSLFPRLSSRADLDDWNYDLDGFPWVVTTDSEDNTVVHGDEHGGNFFVGEAESSEGPPVLPIDFFDAVFWKGDQPQSVGGTDGWRIFSSSLEDEPQVQPMEEQLNAVASFARLIVGLLQQRHAKHKDDIDGVLQQSLQAVRSTLLPSTKDKPKHNAMFLFAALDWATYWHEHPSGDRLGEEGYDHFNEAILDLLRKEASVVSRAFEVQYGENATGDGAAIDAEIERSTTSAQAQAWKNGHSIALLRSSSMDSIERQGLEHRRRSCQRIPVFENESKKHFDATKKNWFIDAKEDWQQECVDALRSWIGHPHDIWLAHPGDDESSSPFARYEMAVWLPDSTRDSFSTVASKLSIHPWTEQWGDLGAKASLRYTIDPDLEEHEKFLAVIRLVMDLILQGLHLQEGPIDQTVYQNMMYAAGTSRHEDLKLANVNFGVGDVLEQPASDAGQHEVNIDQLEEHLELLQLNMGGKGVPFVPEHSDMWGFQFLKWALDRPGLEDADKDALQNEMAHFPRSKDDPLPRGLAYYAKWQNQPPSPLQKYMTKTGKKWLRRYLGSELLNPGTERLRRDVFGIMEASR